MKWVLVRYVLADTSGSLDWVAVVAQGLGHRRRQVTKPSRSRTLPSGMSAAMSKTSATTTTKGGATDEDQSPDHRGQLLQDVHHQAGPRGPAEAGRPHGRGGDERRAAPGDDRHPGRRDPLPPER